MTPVLTEMTAPCAVCGEVASEHDLYYVDAEDAADYDLEPGDIICRDCADTDAE